MAGNMIQTIPTAAFAAWISQLHCQAPRLGFPRFAIMRISHYSLLFALSLAAIAEADEAAPTLKEVNASITRGVDYLVENQNKNGSWGSATRTKALNIYAPIPGAHHAFRAGATGLALSGMLDANDPRPEVQKSIDKAAEWTAATMPTLRRADQKTMYNMWGHAYGLRAMARLYQREDDAEAKKKWVKLAEEQVELCDRYNDVTGGWGYYDIRDDLTTKVPSGIPTSFTTGTVLLALAEARDVMGVKLTDKTIQEAVANITRQRTPDFSYTYGHSHRMYPRIPINRPAGSLGRSQVCNAALRTFGDEAVTDEVMIEWADRFLARIGFLDNGRKRPIPHEAKFQIAGYFYYYAVFYYTRSVDMLPKEKQLPYAEKLAAILLEKQEKDGSWWDYPLYNYHQPYGSGYALMALSWCRDVMSEAESKPKS